MDKPRLPSFDGSTEWTNLYRLIVPSETKVGDGEDEDGAADQQEIHGYSYRLRWR